MRKIGTSIVAALAGCLSGCNSLQPDVISPSSAASGTRPTLDLSLPSTAIVKSGPESDDKSAVRAPVAAHSNTEMPSVQSGNPTEITQFRNASVILYYTETGHDGERVYSATLSLPIRIRAINLTTQRFEISTVQGTRWIDRAEALLK